MRRHQYLRELPPCREPAEFDGLFSVALDVRLGDGTQGNLRLLRDSDSPPRMFLIGADRNAKPYDVTGKSDEQIRLGVASGNYGRLKLLAPRPTAIPPVGANRAATKTNPLPSSLPANAEAQASLNRTLDTLTKGKIRSVEAFRDYLGPDRAQLETQLNTGVKAASGGRLATWEALLAKSKDPAPASKAGFNPAATVTYSLTGAVASYNILVSSGMSSQAALATLPAGFVRDLINIGISQVPLDVKNPLLTVAVKGSVGGVLTLATNAAAGKIHPPALPPAILNGGMALAAFTVNGAIVGLKELQSRGYVGGLPPENPANAKEWFHKYGPDSAAIGVGVFSAILPAVWLNGLKTGAPLTPAQLLKAGVMMLTMPTLQGLFSNAIVNPPKDGWLDTSKFPPGTVDKLKGVASALSSVGLYVAADKVWSVISSFGKPMAAAGSAAAKWSMGASAALGGWLAALGQATAVMTTGATLIGRNIDDVNQARQSLADIDKLLKHPFTYLSNPNPALNGYEATEARDQGIAGLKAAREQILKRYPELRQGV